MEMENAQFRGHSARLTVPRFSLGTAGFLTAVLGAWGGIVPFVGPTFGYSADGAGSWHWDLAHALLSLAPGAVALAAGLLILTRAGAKMHHPALPSFAGLFALLAGAWFVIGAVAWPVMYNVASFFAPGTASAELEYFIGYFGGAGCLLIALGAFVVGRSATSARAPQGLHSSL
ncbi:MAG TPA: hypothetical protein VED84_07805 [Acidimicrobiales bacterium]|nr:hypothetical protein [Acidimicrobiales bacterium]